MRNTLNNKLGALETSGNKSAYTRFPRLNGKVDFENGTYAEEEKFRLNMKYTDQFCGCFGVAFDNDGVKGKILPSYYYFNCKVQTMASYELS